MTVQIASEKGISEFLYAGGVSSSLFIRDNLNKQINKYNKSHLTINTYFSNPKLSSDNAVGTALLGRAKYGNQSY